MTTKSIKTSIACANFRQSLLDDTYYYKILKVLSQPDGVEEHEPPRIRKQLKAERENAIWWVKKMRESALRSSK